MTGAVTAALVDSDAHVRNAYAADLASQGVSVVASSAECDGDVESAQPHVVVINLMLSDGVVTGSQVAGVMRQGASLVGLSISQDADSLRQAVRLGFAGVVSRSSSGAEVAAAIREAAQGRDWITAQWAAAVDAFAYESGTELSLDEELMLSALASGESATAIAERTGAHPSIAADVVRAVRTRAVSHLPIPGTEHPERSV